jgi:2-aminoethylphosphonate-pyruvate transaminase
MKNDYILLTPGPLSTSTTVREAMLKDWCTWDDDYNKDIVEVIREKLVKIATAASDYTCVLMQGSGTAAVEATIGSVISNQGKLLVIDNGVYGARMAQIAQCLNILLRMSSHWLNGLIKWLFWMQCRVLAGSQWILAS